MDSIDIIALIFILFRFVVIIPIMVYGLCLFQKHRNNEFFVHRNPLLIYSITMATILTLSLERTFLICTFVWNIVNVDVWVVYFVLSIFWWALFALFGIKVYNLYYHQQYNISIADNVWKRELNPETVDWYIQNKHKWGNAVWLIKVCIIPYIISCAGDAVFPQIFGEGPPVDFFHSCIITLPIMVAFVVVYKARKVRDIWRIRDEAFIQVVLTLFGLIGYMITFCIGYIPHLHQSYGYNNIYRLNWTVISFFADICTIAFAVVPTLFPIYLIKKQNDVHVQALTKQYLSSDDIKLSINSMNHVMSKYQSFQLFMKHLVSELAAENALFLIELVQIKHNYQKQHNYKVTLSNTDNKQIDFSVDHITADSYTSEQQLYFTYLFHKIGSIRSKICIPIEVPMSMIVIENKDDLSQQMVSLYNKYVAVNRLNISHTVHDALDEIFASQNESNDNQMLFNVMDESAAEVFQLLRQSFTRFIVTKAFVPILQDIKNEMKDKDGKIHLLHNSKSI